MFRCTSVRGMFVHSNWHDSRQMQICYSPKPTSIKDGQRVDPRSWRQWSHGGQRIIRLWAFVQALWRVFLYHLQGSKSKNGLVRNSSKYVVLIMMCLVLGDTSENILVSQRGSLQVNDDVAQKLFGYKHLFLISDFWSKVFKTPFYNWFSKNWGSEAMVSLRNHWGVHNAHMQREKSFKGKTTDMESLRVLSLPFAAATSAGVITLLGALGQNRGLAQSCQLEAVKVLDRLCSCIQVKSFQLRLLPDFVVEVTDLMVSMTTFLDEYLPCHQKSFKQRYFGCT